MREANAIETAYLRCALLAAADSARLQRDLAAYTDARVRAYLTTDTAVHSAADTTALRLQNRLWNDFTQRTRQNRTPPTIIVAAASAFNDVFDDAAAQRDAYNDRTPIPILVLLFVAVPLAGAVIGVGFGRGGAHHLALSATFAALAALTVFTILDLDDPQQGFIGNDVSAIRALGLTGSH